MAKIINVKGRQVFDSRGNPTVEAEVFSDNNISATAISPSGASTGAFEAYELRDQDTNNFLGKKKILFLFYFCFLFFLFCFIFVLTSS